MNYSLYPPDGAHWWSASDHATVVDVVRRLRARQVLEFGPGTSTLALIEGGAERIDCAEDDPHWLAVHESRMAASWPTIIRMHGYAWADPLAIPALDVRAYDMALIDGPRETERRIAVLEYCLARCRAVLIPLEEETETRYGLGYLRPRVLAIAERTGREVELIESGPLAGTFALLTC